jgi:hypothetical protein
MTRRVELVKTSAVVVWRLKSKEGKQGFNMPKRNKKWFIAQQMVC